VGGLGKTTLAAALCHHDDIIAMFDDGILWVTVGSQPNVYQGLAKLYAALTRERPGPPGGWRSSRSCNSPKDSSNLNDCGEPRQTNTILDRRGNV
jgi:NB-ARC domain